MNSIHNTIIIGSGCAGLTSAIYLGRAMLKPLVITGVLWGGELSQTTDVENFPGFPDAILGPDLIQNMKTQAEKFGAEFLNENVVDIDISKRPFRLTTNTKKEFYTHSVIVATGSSTRWLGIENETKLKGFGLSSCVVCDAFFFKNKDVAVVGGGDSAFEGALYLSKFCNKVSIIHRSERFKASKILVERVKKNEKISFFTNYKVDKWLSDKDGLTGAVISHVVSGVDIGIDIHGAFICIGHDPNTSFLSNKLELDETGYIKTEGDSTKTSVDGIFAAGDVCVDEKNYKQAVTASGSGCKAALDCEKYLETKMNLQ